MIVGSPKGGPKFRLIGRPINANVGGGSAVPWWVTVLQPAFYFDAARGIAIVNGSSVPIDSTFTVARNLNAYEQELSGNWKLFGPNVVRRTDKFGYAADEARTNGIKNDSAQGAATGLIGGTGAYPTGYVNSSGGGNNPLGLNVTITDVGIKNGLEYFAINYQGVPNATSDIRLSLGATTDIAAAQNQVFASSGIVQIVGGDLTNVGQFKFFAQYRDAGGVSLTTGVVNFTPDASYTRYQGVSSGPNASTAFVVPELAFGVTNGQAINVTILFSFPGMEAAPFFQHATSPIRTTNAAVLRPVENIVFSSAGIYGGNGGTLFAEAMNPFTLLASTFPGTFSMNDGTGNNRFELEARQVDNTVRMGGVAATVGQPDMGVAQPGYGTFYRIAARFKPNDVALAVNGGNLQTGAVWTIPGGINQFQVGALSPNNNIMCGFVKKGAYFTAGLSNAQLQQITTLGGV